MTMLREISLLWSMAHTLVLFFLLFKSRHSQKKTIFISCITMIPLCIANIALAFFLDADHMGLILLLTLSLPSLIVFWFLAKNRDGRFFFTFCLVDTIVLEVIFLTQIINFYTTPNSCIVMFILRLAAFPLLEWFVIKKMRSNYLDLQKHTRTGWGLFAIIGVLFYLLMTLMMNYPSSVTERPEYLPATLLLLILIPIIYFHIISTLHRQQSIHETAMQDDILEQQVSSITYRIEEISDANDRFRMERHNFRHKLKTIASLIKTEQYDECLTLLSEYEEALDKTRVKRYCQHTVLDAVLSSYIQKAEDKGISMQIGIAFPDVIPMSEAELATAIANALENAIKACENVEPERRYIEIKVLCYPRFIIRIANSYAESVEFDEDGIPINHDHDHGYGSRFIAAFCQKNEGFYQFSADGENFSLYLNF